MEIDEMVKILILILVLVIMVGMIIFLFKGKGGALLDSIRRVLRFGR